jgi:hypothetical protein
MKVLAVFGKIILGIVGLGFIYILTLLFPEPFFGNKVIVGDVTVYSDEGIPPSEITKIVNEAQNRVSKSILYKTGMKQNVFIANNIWRWWYFSSINYKASGINQVLFNHNIFFRKTDIKNNRLYGQSGNVATGDRTLDYFLAHEMTHALEFQSMPWYKYPLKTNWVLEGYCEYVAHGSQNYEAALNQYLNVPENAGAKYYTRARTMVAYLLEIEKTDISQIWSMVNNDGLVLKKAIPEDKPNIVNE